VDMEKGFQEEIQLVLDGWTYIQIVDYEKIPFKCKYCHEYGHFAKSCPKASQENPENKTSEQWQQAKQKRPVNKQGNPQPEQKITIGPPSPSKGKATIQIEDKGESSENKLDPLDT